MNEPLVLLPGFMTDARIWGAQIEALGARRTVILPPLDGGSTVTGMAERVLADLPPRVALAGVSLGGMVAMEMLRLAPDRITRLAFVATNSQAVSPGNAAERELRIAKAKAGKLSEALAGEYPPTAFAPAMRDAVQGFVLEMGQAMGAEAYLAQANALQRRPDQQRVLRQSRLPALFLCGALDPIHLPRRHEFMAELMPRGRVRVIPEAGHAPTLEAPEAVNEAMAAWLEEPAEKSLLR